MLHLNVDGNNELKQNNYYKEVCICVQHTLPGPLGILRAGGRQTTYLGEEHKTLVSAK